MPRTPKVVEDRRVQILEAAMRVFSQKGFSRATNKDIAREANITPGLIYHYFESKEALLKAIIEERSPLGLMRSLPPDVFNLPPTTFIPFIIKQVMGLIEGTDFVQIMRMILPELLHNPTIQPIGFHTLQQAIGFLEQYLARKMEQGELRQTDPRLAAQVLVGSLMGFILRRQILGDPMVLEYTHEQICMAISDTALNGLLL